MQDESVEPVVSEESGPPAVPGEDPDEVIPPGLRRKARQAEHWQQRAERLEKELAVTRNLGPLSELQMNAVLSVHAGELTNEALWATADALGLAATGSFVPRSELDAHDRIAAASAGSESVTRTNPVDEILAAQTPEEVEAAYVKAGGRIAGYD